MVEISRGPFWKVAAHLQIYEIKQWFNSFLWLCNRDVQELQELQELNMNIKYSS